MTGEKTKGDKFRKMIDETGKFRRQGFHHRRATRKGGLVPCNRGEEKLMRCSLSAMRPDDDREKACNVQTSDLCPLVMGRAERRRFHFANSANDEIDIRWVSVRGIQFHRFVGRVTLSCRGEVCRSGTASHSCYFRINNFLLSDIVCIDALAHHTTRKSSYMRVCILGHVHRRL